MIAALGMKAAPFAGAFGANACFSRHLRMRRRDAREEPKQGKNVAEIVHLLFKMTFV